MANDTPLVEGVRVFDKHASAPDFVICSIVITTADFISFIASNPTLLTEYNGKKQLKLQINRSQGGKIYAKVDTYQREGGTTANMQGKPTDVDPLPF